MKPGEGLFTDLYELTMLQAYFNQDMEETAVFDLFIRSLPPERGLMIACGLDQALAFLESLSFDDEALAYLDSLRLFSPAFLDYLSKFRFTGDVRAIREGSAVFPFEPLLEVTAPLPQAQVVETFLLNQVTFQTAIASKGARAMAAARGRRLVDFGSRRAHGTDAGNKAARALYLVGYQATSNVLAGKLFGIPVAGTMAHSYIQAHDDEAEAFRRFVETFPETTLLVDTYDTVEGVRRVAKLAQEMAGTRTIRAVRLDSGDLVELSKRARAILDEAGLHSIEVFASGGLDEVEIAHLLDAGALIDGFGVGTSAVVSMDAPTLDSAYKLVSYAGKPRIKLSKDKATLPGRKQVFRRYDGVEMRGDVIGLDGEAVEGSPLLEAVMRGGERTAAGKRTLVEAREHALQEQKRLPDALLALQPDPYAYAVDLSAGLEAERARVTALLQRR